MLSTYPVEVNVNEIELCIEGMTWQWIYCGVTEFNVQGYGDGEYEKRRQFIADIALNHTL